MKTVDSLIEIEVKSLLTDAFASFAVTGDSGSNILSAPGSAYSNDTRLFFRDITGSGLSTGGAGYFVVNAATDTFQLSLTTGGDPIALGSPLTAGTISRVMTAFPIYAGQQDGVRPDQYVSVVATQNDPRGRMSLVTLEFRAVCSTYPLGNLSPALVWIQSTQGAIYEWIMDNACPINGYDNNDLIMCGHSPASFRSELRDHQRAGIVSIKVGAAVDIP